MSCLDLESMRECTIGTLVKQALRLLLIYIVERIFLKLVQQNHSTIYISRSLSACFTRVPLVHSLMLSRSKKHIGGHTLSQLMAGHKSGRTTSTGAGV